MRIYIHFKSGVYFLITLFSAVRRKRKSKRAILYRQHHTHSATRNHFTMIKINTNGMSLFSSARSTSFRNAWIYLEFQRSTLKKTTRDSNLIAKKIKNCASFKTSIAHTHTHTQTIRVRVTIFALETKCTEGVKEKDNVDPSESRENQICVSLHKQKRRLLPRRYQLSKSCLTGVYRKTSALF